MANYLSYNGIVIDVMRTLRYEEQHLKSPDGSDRIGTKVTIEVEGVYGPGATSYSGNPFDGGLDPIYGNIGPTTEKNIREALALPRCQLLYVCGGVTVLRSPAEGYLVDIANGPLPLKHEVVKITPRTWHVRFAIETTISDCVPTDHGILSNRWSQTHSIGEDRLTTIITQGVAIFRMDHLAKIGRNADHFRDHLLPHTPQGFQRKTLSIGINPIGNVIQYQIVDRERFVNLGNNPYGVIEFAAEVSANSVQIGQGQLSSVASTVMIATFQGKAWGSKGPGYRSGNLMTWLTRLAIERLQLPVPDNIGDNGNSTYVLTNVAASASVDRPEASLSISVRIPPPKDGDEEKNLGPTRIFGRDGLLADVRSTPIYPDLFDNKNGTNPNLPFGTNSRGYHLGELYAQALRACLANCEEPTVPKIYVLAQPQFDPFALPSDPADDPEDEESFVSPGHFYSIPATESPFSYYEVRTHYSTDTGQVVAPVAGDGTQPPLVFRVSNPITWRVVQFTGERIGAKPPIPNLESRDLGEVLVGAPKFSFAPPIPAPDGNTKVYRVTGEATYVRMDSKSLLDPGDTGLAMGAVPWATFEYEDASNRFLREDRADGIIGPRFTTA